MKSIIFVPFTDYFRSRKRVVTKFIAPFIVAGVALLASLVFNIGDAETVFSTFHSFINMQINIVAILISFSVAIITIIVSADNENTKRLKNTDASELIYKTINGRTLSLFQILLSNIAYNIIIEIIYLIGLIAISLMQTMFTVECLKYITTLCIFSIVHILFVLLESVAQMYLTFWNNK